jgi:hypothetical protein
MPRCSQALETDFIPDRAERIVIAQISENSYTAIETALSRIAQGFGPCIASVFRWCGLNSPRSGMK